MRIPNAQLTQLINLLDERSITADDALYDLMEHVRRDLVRLDGDVERLPHEGYLREWGLLDEIRGLQDPSLVEPPQDSAHGRLDELTVVNLPPMTKDQVELIRKKLRAHGARLTGPEKKRIDVMRVAIGDWFSQGMLGPLPYADELEQMSIWSPEEQIVAREIRRADEMLAAGKTDDALNFLNKLSARFQDAEAKYLVEQSRNRVELLVARREIAPFEEMLAKRDYERALIHLNALLARFQSPGAQREIKAALSDVERERNIEIAARGKRAIQITLASHDDLVTQEQAWKAVQELDPENLAAERAILEIGKKKGQFQLARELNELAPILEWSLAAKDLKKLNEIRDDYDRLALLLRGTDFETKANEKQTEFYEKYNKLRDELSIVPTRQNGQEYRVVYAHARAYVEGNIPYVEYLVRGTPQMIASIEALERSAQDFTNFLQAKAYEALDRSPSCSDDPQEALNILESTLELISDPILLPDHRVMLESLQNKLLKGIKEAKEMVIRYEEAEKLIEESKKVDLQNRIDLLLRANERFSAYPGLKEYIKNAGDEWQYLQETRTRNVLNQAVEYANQGQYAKAFEMWEHTRSACEAYGGSSFQLYLEVGEKIFVLQRQKENIKQAKEKLLIVLDIDESLVYSSDDPLAPNAHFEFVGYHVTKRPFLDPFLSKIFEWYDVAIWTGATAEYAKYIIPQIIPDPTLLKFVWARDRCTLKLDYDKGDYFWLKDIKKLERIQRKKEKILFIEDDPRVFQRSYGNLIEVTPFTGSFEDNELQRLTGYLEELREVDDVRKIDKGNWRARHQA